MLTQLVALSLMSSPAPSGAKESEMEKQTEWPYWHHDIVDDVVRFHVGNGCYFDVRLLPGSEGIEIRGMSGKLDVIHVKPRSGNVIQLSME